MKSRVYLWSQRLSLAASSISRHLYVFHQGLSLNCKLINLVRPAGQWTSGTAPPHQEGDYRYLLPCPAFGVGSGDLNSGPWACEAETLLTEPSPYFNIKIILNFYMDKWCADITCTYPAQYLVLEHIPMWYITNLRISIRSFYTLTLVSTCTDFYML